MGCADSKEPKPASQIPTKPEASKTASSPKPVDSKLPTQSLGASVDPITPNVRKRLVEKSKTNFPFKSGTNF